MKKIFVILLCLILCLGLLGCDELEPAESTYEVAVDTRFELIKKYSDCSLLVDKETSIVYVWRSLYEGGRTGIAGFTVLLDAEGKPVLWNK